MTPDTAAPGFDPGEQPGAPAATAVTPSCAFHGERPAIALCVRCSTAICSDCTTRFQGINHCSRCVSALRRPSPETRPDAAARTLVTAVAAYGLLAAVFYALAVAVAQ